jgi:hypothetical protein
MKRAIVFLLLVLAVSLVAPVFAQTATPSPTPSSTPTATPTETPTPTPTQAPPTNTPLPTQIPTPYNVTYPTPTPRTTFPPASTPTPQPTNTSAPLVGVTYDVQTQLNLYATAKVTISYVYTANFTGPVGMTTASNSTLSIWHLDESPESMQFYTSDLDTYTFDIVLSYSQTIDQTVIITSWSGDLQPNTMRYHIDNDVVYLHFVVSVSKEPTYPSTEDVANESVNLMRGDLQTYYTQIDTLTNELTMNTWEMWAVWAGTVVTVIISLVVSLVTLRKLQAW